MKWTIAVALVAGCGRLHFDAVGDAGDAGGDVATADACAFGPFAAARELAELDSVGEEEGPWLSEDRLELLYSSTQTGFKLIYRARRTSVANPFDPPVAIAGLPNGSDDPFVTDDGLSLWFDHATSVGVGTLMLATRTSTAAEFTNPQTVSELSSGPLDGAPDLTSDELTIVFDSTRNSSGAYHLFVATRARKTDPFGAPVSLALEPTGDDGSGSLSGDGHSMILETDAIVVGFSRLASSQLTTPTQASPPQLFAPELAPPAGEDVDPFLTHDGRTLVFSSTRPGGAGSYDLYLADRACL